MTHGASFSPLALLDATGGDVELCDALLADFHRGMEVHLRDLEHMADIAVRRARLHALRGSACAIGAHALADAAAKAEAAPADLSYMLRLRAEISQVPRSFRS